jgi:hypothetical protein
MPVSTPTSAADSKPDFGTLESHVAKETRNFSLQGLERLDSAAYKKHMRAMQQGPRSVAADTTLFVWSGVGESLDKRQAELASQISTNDLSDHDADNNPG